MPFALVIGTPFFWVGLYWSSPFGSREKSIHLVDDYIDRHKETLDLLSNPDWVKKIEQGKREVLQNVKGKSLNDLED